MKTSYETETGGKRKRWHPLLYLSIFRAWVGWVCYTDQTRKILGGDAGCGVSVIDYEVHVG